MVSPLIAKAHMSGREIVNVTPQRAGWIHVGFRAIRLADGETESLDTGTRELCIVVLLPGLSPSAKVSNARTPAAVSGQSVGLKKKK